MRRGCSDWKAGPPMPRRTFFEDVLPGGGSRNPSPSPDRSPSSHASPVNRQPRPLKRDGAAAAGSHAFQAPAVAEHRRVGGQARPRSGKGRGWLRANAKRHLRFPGAQVSRHRAPGFEPIPGAPAPDGKSAITTQSESDGAVPSRQRIAFVPAWTTRISVLRTVPYSTTAVAFDSPWYRVGTALARAGRRAVWGKPPRRRARGALRCGQ